MFLLNKGYTWSIETDEKPEGIILGSTSMPSEQFVRRFSKSSEFEEIDTLLFDPQLYFFKPDNQNLVKTTNFLCTYDWFHHCEIEYDSSVMSIKDYRDTVKESEMCASIDLPSTGDEIKQRIISCLNFQNALNVSYLILPTPLVYDAEDQFTTQLHWILPGIEIANEIYPHTEKLITLALTEDVIVSKNLEDNILMQTVIDNLSSLNDIDGYYIVVNRERNGNFISERRIVTALLELSYILGHQLNRKVFINFADTLGLLCLSVGAYAFASGYTNKEKRFNFSDYEDRDSGGPALPHFYSNSLIGDYFPYRDLNKIKEARLLFYIKKDINQYSQALYNSLANNTNQIVAWKETYNNLAFAKKHRIHLMQSLSRMLDSKTFAEKVESSLDWLQEAESRILYLNERFKDDPLSETGKHVAVWRSCLDDLITKYNIL